MNKSEQINELAAALAKAQGKIKGAIKDSINPHYKSKFADLDGCWDVAREPLSSNGLSIIQLAGSSDGRVVVTTMLAHSSGQWIASDLCLPVAQATAQAIGAAITYGRRYGFCAMVGVTQEDDDGNSASRAVPQPAAKGYDGGTAHQKALQTALKTKGIDEGIWEDIHMAMLGKSMAELDHVVREVTSQ